MADDYSSIPEEDSELQLIQSDTYNPIPLLMTSLYRLSRIRSFIASGSSLPDYENTLLDLEVQLSFDLDKEEANSKKARKNFKNLKESLPPIKSVKEQLKDLIVAHNDDVKKNKLHKKELSGGEKSHQDKLYLKYLDNKYKLLKSLVDRAYRKRQYGEY